MAFQIIGTLKILINLNDNYNTTLGH